MIPRRLARSALAAAWPMACRASNERPLFQMLDATRTGVRFANRLPDATAFNILNYLYYGLLLRGDGKGNFTPVERTRSGFVVPCEARDIQRVKRANGDLYVVARNNDRPLVFKASKTAVTRSIAARPVRGVKASSF